MPLLFLCAPLGVLLGGVLPSASMAFKAPRLMRTAAFGGLGAVMALTLLMIGIAAERPAFWFLVVFFVAFIAFAVWGLFKNAAERRASQRTLDVGSPPSRGRTWDREERPPTE